jgi:hypothetical protein
MNATSNAVTAAAAARNEMYRTMRNAEKYFVSGIRSSRARNRAWSGSW